MPQTETKPMVLDMKCGCGAALYVEVTPGYSWDFGQLIELSKAWVAAHRDHHVEPMKEPKP